MIFRAASGVRTAGLRIISVVNVRNFASFSKLGATRDKIWRSWTNASSWPGFNLVVSTLLFFNASFIPSLVTAGLGSVNIFLAASIASCSPAPALSASATIATNDWLNPGTSPWLNSRLNWLSVTCAISLLLDTSAVALVLGTGARAEDALLLPAGPLPSRVGLVGLAAVSVCGWPCRASASPAASGLPVG